MVGLHICITYMQVVDDLLPILSTMINMSLESGLVSLRRHGKRL